jgi:hypothetical protein
MIQPKELIVPLVTIFALLFAIFAFLFPKTVELSNQRRNMVSKLEMPDSIRKNWRFRVGSFGDIIVLYLTGMTSLLLAVIYCPILLNRIVNFYLGSQTTSTNQMLNDFSDLTFGLAILASFILVAAMSMLVNDLFISEKSPTLVKIYSKAIFEKAAKDEDILSLLPEAEKLVTLGKYPESILHSTAALEYVLKRILGLRMIVGLDYRWSELVEKAKPILKASSVKKLEKVRRIRNIVAHPTPNRPITKLEATNVLKAVNSLLYELEQSDLA